MTLTYEKATQDDIGPIYELCKKLIDDYEQTDTIDYPRVLQWVRRKIETAIAEYTVIYADERKAGYYHFYKNDAGAFEIDDLYILPPYQNKGIGSQVVQKCCASVDVPVMLYVFTQNDRAVQLYQRLGFTIVETVHDTRYIMKKENTAV